MFERRLKILLGVLLAASLMLLLRAAWLQIVQGSEYQKRAFEIGKRSTPIEASRGRILDIKGRVIAEDAPCLDACVDYRAVNLTRDSEEWLRNIARNRVLARGELKGARDDRARLIDQELIAVHKDIQAMWKLLAEVSSRSVDDIEQVRQGIIRRVEMRRRYVWYKRYEEARHRHERENRQDSNDSWLKWLIDDSTPAPELDSFKVTVAEQTETHVVLRAIDNETYIKLNNLKERCPGLELRKNTHRYYPYADIACHVIGSIGPVLKEDLERNAHVLAADADDSRKYFYNDMIGRSGLERLCEPELRGRRGSIVRQVGKDAVEQTTPPTTGQDVQITLDIELQMRIQEAFQRYKEHDDPQRPGEDLRAKEIPVHEMHGAAVVLDIPTRQVRAMVSYPTYDLNQFDQIYPVLVKDLINQPLLNRATQAALEPGSTIKPVVGLAAISSGKIPVNKTIECTGYLYIDSRQRREGRCWVATKFGHLLPSVAHHPIPSRSPHPTGFLTYADALERSCNVFFETLGDLLGLEGLGEWYRKFGLGTLTEIGIAEARGRVPGEVAVPNARSAAWFSAIGQTQVLATPLQMANVAATIADGGKFIRPHLRVSETASIEPRQLPLDRDALRQAVYGMKQVVNGSAGTGDILKRNDILIAGKTGTAQAAMFNIIVRDDAGKPVRDANGRIKREFFKASTAREPNAKMPWYRGSGSGGSELGHAWFIGFAPADHPRIAFAVLVEYGGSGGRDAGPVAQTILEACLEGGYLQADKR